jgi:hypothetical protein
VAMVLESVTEQHRGNGKQAKQRQPVHDQPEKLAVVASEMVATI